MQKGFAIRGDVYTRCCTSAAWLQIDKPFDTMLTIAKKSKNISKEELTDYDLNSQANQSVELKAGLLHLARYALNPQNYLQSLVEDFGISQTRLFKLENVQKIGFRGEFESMGGVLCAFDRERQRGRVQDQDKDDKFT